MPSWKKVILSGSDATLNSLYVTTNVTASSFTGSFTGSLSGNASTATSASHAITSSYALQALPADSAVDYLGSCFDKADSRLLSDPSAMFYVTRSIADNFRKTLRTKFLFVFPISAK